MKFYTELLTDTGETLPFEVEAASAHDAMLLVGAYCKGRFEASGQGADVERLSKTKSRGVEYRRLA